MDKLSTIHDYAKDHNVPIMMDDGILFLLNFIDKVQPKSILEIGTAIGYSAISMANTCLDASIDTLEIDFDRYCKAILNIQDHHLEHRIIPFFTDAFDFFPNHKYDFIFVDAAKSQYRRYMEYFLPFLNDGGYYFFDNLNFHGIVDNPELSDNRSTLQMCAKIKKFRDWLLENPNLSVEYHPEIGDGIAIVSVKKRWL